MQQHMNSGAETQSKNMLLIIFSILSVILTVFGAPTTLKSHISIRSAPNVPSGPDALVLLNGLTVAVKGSQDGYSRSKFPLWLKQNGTCNTREIVLQRDGTSVVVNSACQPTSGTWLSPYDAATWTKSVDLVQYSFPIMRMRASYTN